MNLVGGWFLPAVWGLLGMTIVVASLYARHHRVAYTTGIWAVSILWVVAGAGANLVMLVDGSTYTEFASRSPIPFVPDTWEALVVPNHHFFIGLLIVFEAVAGVAVLWRGRPRSVALMLLVLFNVTLVVFGWGLLAWAAPLALALVLLLRAGQTQPVPELDRAPALPDHNSEPSVASVRLYWIPLGAGGHLVRWCGRIYEQLAAHRERRVPAALYHSALEVRIDRDRYMIEMAPVWAGPGDHGAVQVGPVGAHWLGRSRVFQYEVRQWRDGLVPDADQAVSAQCVGADRDRARRLLELVPQAPALTWGRDELRAGDMWNSNSLVSWLLARSAHHVSTLAPPRGGRTPGWRAGLVLAGRQSGDQVSAQVGSGTTT